MNAKELFEFVKARKRMCEFFDNSSEGCINCKLYEIGNCNPLNCNSVDEAQKLISAVEKWAKEHPIKTRQSELLKLFPKVDIDGNAVVALCPEYFGFESKHNEYGVCVKDRGECQDCVDCRRKFWLTEIHE